MSDVGTKPASAAGAGTFMHSNRYVLKQTYTAKNIAGVDSVNINYRGKQQTL